MKLTAKTDLDVPAGFVFATLADHDGWESMAQQRGAQVERPADMPLDGIGAGWRLRFPFRGKTRKLLVWVKDMRPDQMLTYAFEGTAVEGSAVLEVIVLSARRSRMRVALTVRPRTLAARLFLNTLRLAKRKVQARYDRRLDQLADLIQTRYAQGRTG